MEAIAGAGLERAVLDVDTASPTRANTLNERLGFAPTELGVVLVRHLQARGRSEPGMRGRSAGEDGPDAQQREIEAIPQLSAPALHVLDGTGDHVGEQLATLLARVHVVLGQQIEAR